MNCGNKNRKHVKLGYRNKRKGVRIGLASIKVATCSKFIMTNTFNRNKEYVEKVFHLLPKETLPSWDEVVLIGNQKLSQPESFIKK